VLQIIWQQGSGRNYLKGAMGNRVISCWGSRAESAGSVTGIVETIRVVLEHIPS
jgi:hypothetical protein